MKDEEVKDLVFTHDKHIEVMSQSIEHLAEAVGTTNRKMEDIIDVLSTQNVLMERVNNIDENLKESFGRVHTNIRDNADKLGDIVEESRNKLPNWVLKWVLGSLVTYAIIFGVYATQQIHKLDNASTSHASASVIRDKYVDDKLIEHSGLLNRNYGALSELSKVQ